MAGLMCQRSCQNTTATVESFGSICRRDANVFQNQFAETRAVQDPAMDINVRLLLLFVNGGMDIYLVATYFSSHSATQDKGTCHNQIKSVDLERHRPCCLRLDALPHSQLPLFSQAGYPEVISKEGNWWLLL